VDTFGHSSCGTVVMTLCQGLLTAPSWHACTYLACGWALATDRHTITTYVGLTGATTVKPCSRFYVFLGCPFSNRRGQLWGAVLRLALQVVPTGAGLQVRVDDTTKQKAGPPLAGVARDRHGAGSARQAYRTRRGLNIVLGLVRVPRPRWPGHRRSLPVGRALSRNPAQAHARNVPYRASRQLARALRDCLAAQVPGRPLRSLADGGSATTAASRP
jgi:hypothetical protein